MREFTRDRQRTVEVFFDRRIGPGQQERFEELVENCASLLWGLCERNIQRGERDAQLWLRSQRFAVALPEEGEIYDLLKFLALVEPLMLLNVGEEAGLDEDPADAQRIC